MLVTISHVPPGTPDELHLIHGAVDNFTEEGTIVDTSPDLAAWTVYVWSEKPLSGVEPHNLYRSRLTFFQAAVVQRGIFTFNGCDYRVIEGSLRRLSIEESERVRNPVPPTYIRHDLDGLGVYMHPDAMLERIEPGIWLTDATVQLHGDVIMGKEPDSFPRSVFRTKLLSRVQLKHMHNCRPIGPKLTHSGNVVSRQFSLDQSYEAVHFQPDAALYEYHLAADEQYIWCPRNVYRASLDNSRPWPRLNEIGIANATADEKLRDASRQFGWWCSEQHLLHINDWLAMQTGESISDIAPGYLCPGRPESVTFCDGLQRFYVTPNEIKPSFFTFATNEPDRFAFYPDQSPLTQAGDMTLWILPKGTVLIETGEPVIVV